jgi:energy-coupling factor transporter ATP-binding protein EcfA2
MSGGGFGIPEAFDIGPGPRGGKKRRPAKDLLTEIALGDELFLSDGEVFASCPEGDHVATYPVMSRSYRNSLAARFFRSVSSPPGGQAVEDTLRVVCATAFSDGREQKVNLRVAGDDEIIYLDLADATWRQVRISRDGWDIIEAVDSPARFIRSRGMQPLPVPHKSGGLDRLRPFMNIEASDLALLAAWLIAALRPTGPYPVLCLGGEQGSGKSTGARFLRRLIDPNSADIRTLPREERDLIIAARNSWILAFDNVSSIPLWTGAGFATRQLHTDLDEVIVSACRPILLNGIGDLSERADLADRSIAISLPTIRPTDRRLERDFWTTFEAEHAALLGWLLDAVATALARLPDVKLAQSPRMADFAHWATAAEPALGLANGEFLRIYQDNSDGLVQATVDSDAVATAIYQLAATRSSSWEGTASELLEELRQADAGGKVTGSKYFPQAGNALSQRVRRVAPALRRRGVDVSTGRAGHDRRRLITIVRTAGFKSPAITNVWEDTDDADDVPF